MSVGQSALLAVLLALGATAQAAPSPALVREAKRRFERANQLYDAGQYADALHAYQAAYDLVPAREILFNLGLAREKTFDYEGCALALRKYLDGAGEAARSEQASQRLEQCRARARVPVKLTSMPPSSAVFLGEGDARSPRGRTPTSIELAPGRYTVSVEAPGYLAQSQALAVEEGARPEIDFQLERLSSLRIETDVAGARVKIDGVSEGEAPLQRERRAGTYRVEVEKEGHRAARREVRVSPGEQVSLVMALPPLPQERRIAVELAAGRARAQVRLDGDLLGAPPLVHSTLAGPHHLEVAAPGHRSYAGAVRLRADQDLRLRVRLAPERTWIGWALLGSLLGGAGVSLVVGAAFGGLALEDQRRYEARPWLELRDEAFGHARGADIAFGVAGGLGLAGLIYYLATIPGRSEVEVLR